MPQEVANQREGKNSYQWLLLLAVAIGVAIAGWRVVTYYQAPGAFDRANQGFCDFHNGIYFPSRATLDGVSPYGEDYAASYPVARPLPLFSPATLLVHAPLAWLPLRAAELVYFVSCIVLLGLVGYFTAVCLRRESLNWSVALLTMMLLTFSRPGHLTLFSGYFTIEMMLGVILSLEYAQRKPWLAAIGVLLASYKPTTLLPLLAVMLMRKNYAAAWRGFALSVGVALLPMLWLAWCEGPAELLNGMLAGQESHMANPHEMPVNTWERIDLLAIIAKWSNANPGMGVHLLTMGVFLVPVIPVLKKLASQGDNDGAATPSGAIASLAILVTVYHQFYDLMLLAPAIAGAFYASPAQWHRYSRSLRIGLVTLMLIPFWNIFSTSLFLDRVTPEPVWHQVITSLNGVMLLAALVFLMLSVLRCDKMKSGQTS